MTERDYEPYFSIGVVSRMLNMHPQTIRNYERLGFITPGRTQGNIRLYSRNDIERLKIVNTYTNMGVNLAGVEMIIRITENMERMRMEMESEMEILKREIEKLQGEPL
jgi:MerR family transcriptional regulator/heat shock protein HspR